MAVKSQRPMRPHLGSAGRNALGPPHPCLFVLRVCADQPLCNFEPFLVWINYCLNNIGRVAVDVLTAVAITQVRKIYLTLGSSAARVSGI